MISLSDQRRIINFLTVKYPVQPLLKNNKHIQMKSLISSLAILLFAGTLQAQQIVNEVIIQMKTETTSPTDGGGSPPAVSGDGEQRVMIRMGEGEIKSKMYFKNGMTKIESDMGMGNSQVIVDSKTKVTTTLFEAMGKKMGFTSSDSAMQQMFNGRDSGRQQRVQQFNPEVFIEYLGETKKIAGMECKKAVIRYKNRKGDEEQQIVWYSPEFMLGEGFRMRDMMRMVSIPGLNKLKGFPMEFETIRQNGAKVHYQVTKVDLNAKVDDKTFVIPKDYDIKPMSDMRQQGGRNGNGDFQIRVNG
jgi:GLPGLI family protein